MIDLINIRKRIEGETEDARFTAWTELYHSDDPAAQDEITKILSGSDPILKILLCRFLAGIPENRAIQLLLKMATNDNPVLVENALKAFDKNTLEGKIRSLIPLINAPTKEARFFAIETLCTAQVTEAAEPLLQKMITADEPLLEKILSGLRFLADKRILTEVITFTKDTRHSIRFHALMALGSLYEAGHGKVRPLIIKNLSDPSAQIRQGLVWTLNKRPLRRNLPIFIRLMMTDPDPVVRQECVMGLIPFPSNKIIRQLISFLVGEKDKMVRLKGESVLLSIPVKKLISGLKYALRTQDETIKNRVMILYANFQKGSSVYFVYLKKQLKRARDDKARLAIIESLGLLENQQAIPLLEEQLKASPLIAYASMAALTRICGHAYPFPVARYINDPGLSDLLKQIALKHFVKTAAEQHYTPEVIAIFKTLLKQPNLNKRYLAAQALSRLKDMSLLDPFFASLLAETDPTAKTLFKKSITSFAAEAPQSMFPLFEKYRDDPKPLSELISILKDARLSGNQFYALWPQFTAPPLSLLDAPHAQPFIELLVDMIASKQLTITELVHRLSGDKLKITFLTSLVPVLGRRPLLRTAIPLNTINDWLTPDNIIAPPEMIELFKYSDSKQALSMLVGILCSPRHEHLQDCAAQTLNAIIGGAA